MKTLRKNYYFLVYTENNSRYDNQNEMEVPITTMVKFEICNTNANP